MQVWELGFGIAVALRKFNRLVATTLFRRRESSPVESF
jgi:hypothetical protein